MEGPGSVWMVIWAAIMMALPAGVLTGGAPSDHPMGAGAVFGDGGTEVLSGHHQVSDIASSSIYGETFSGKGRLGHFQWTGDVDGDGMNDLVVAAPGALGAEGLDDEGRIYIFYGNGSDLPEHIDLDQEDPDVMITSKPAWRSKQGAPPYPVKGYLTNEFDAGDYNGDDLRDIALAVPETDASSYAVIIYGSSGGFPSRLVVDISTYTVFSQSQGDTSFNWLHGMGQVPGQDALILPDYMRTVDLDGDGADELVSGNVIRWGGTGTFTYLRDNQSQTNIGRSLDIGDIDGDGRPDMIIGAYLTDDPLRGIEDCGAAYVVFNVSRVKGNGSLWLSDIARPVIYGTSELDHLGRNVKLEDIDGDGREEIIVAASDSDDGPSKKDCGQVHMFMGGVVQSFPSTLSPDSSDWTVIGNEGRSFGTNPYPGDCLGQTMEFGDLDGDGRPEAVLGFYSKTSYLALPEVVYDTGAVVVVDAETLFPTDQRIYRLPWPFGKVIMEGNGLGDLLGWQVFTGDVTNDGVDDLLMGAVAADGPEDLRPSDGEVYILTGSHVEMGDLRITGRPFSPPYLFAGGSPFEMNVSFRSGQEGTSATGASFIFGRGPTQVTIGLSASGGTSVHGDASGMTLIEGDCAIGQEKGSGFVRVSLALEWWCRFTGSQDVKVTLEVVEGTAFFRRYPSAFTVSKDVTLDGEFALATVEGPLSGIGEWVLPGTGLVLSGPSAVYTRNRSVPVPDGSLDLIVSDGDKAVASVPVSVGWSIGLVAPAGPIWPLEVELAYPARYGTRPSDMRMDGKRGIEVHIDAERPLPPRNLTARSIRNGLPTYDRDGEFELTWEGSPGTGLDPGGSGVREFQVLEGGSWVPAFDTGGLTGTYYRGKGFEEEAFQRTESDLNFTVKEWGPFGPEPAELRFDDFSVRWHGYFVPLMNGSYALSVRGSGGFRAELDGEVLFSRGDITGGEALELPVMTGGSVHTIVLRFINRLDSSYFSLETWDPALRKVGMDEGPFAHPVNYTSVRTVAGGGPLSIVRSMDWCGRTSDETSVMTIRDDRPPVFDVGDKVRWFNTSSPELTSVSMDPETSEASGLDMRSMEYALERSGFGMGEWSDSDLRKRTLEEREGVLLKAGLSVTLLLDLDWRGYMHFRAMDLAGNLGTSTPVWVGIDTETPVISLVHPTGSGPLYDGNMEVRLHVSDGFGSGIDIISLEHRWAVPDRPWSGWTPMTSVEVGDQGAVSGEVVLPLGDVELQFRVRDLAGNTALTEPYRFEVREPPVNRPPRPIIHMPENGTRFFVGQIVELSALGTWDDGLGPNDALTFTWVSSLEGYLGSGMSLRLKLALGVHEITLYADDGAEGHNISTSITVHVMDWNGSRPGDDDTPGTEDSLNAEALFALIALVVTVIILLLFVILQKRQRGPEEVTLGVRALSEDDRFSNEVRDEDIRSRPHPPEE